MVDKDSNVIKTYGWQEPKCDQVLVWLMVDKDLGPKMQSSVSVTYEFTRTQMQSRVSMTHGWPEPKTK